MLQDKQLSKQPLFPGPQCVPYRELLTAVFTAGQQDAGHVHARDEQDQAYGPQQQEHRGLHLAHEMFPSRGRT